jgi:branched-chain amino acid transport system permease protein
MGPALGAAVLIPMTELTRSYFGGSGTGLDLIIYGVLIMVISLARPAGLASVFTGRRQAVAAPMSSPS